MLNDVIYGKNLNIENENRELPDKAKKYDGFNEIRLGSTKNAREPLHNIINGQYSWLNIYNNK